MELILLGTGCPVVSKERFGPAEAVRSGGSTLLIDCGSGVTQRMAAAGISGRDIDALLLTHLHSDHIVDLFQLVISSWHQGRERPQRVFGPKGTRRYVEGLLQLWQPELKQRIAHECRPSTKALEVEVTEFTAGPLPDVGEMKVRAVEVDHKPVEAAFGFVIEGPGGKLVFSGDTRPCPALEEAAAGARLLLHEVFIHRDLPVVEGVRSARTVENVASYHTLSGDVGKIAARAGVECLVLTHFVPPETDRDALLAEVAADFTGPLVVGEDLLRIDLESGVMTHGDLRSRILPPL
ncbi:MAG: MBL fold metallo-hydrolase [Kiloniellales bacterium]|nr:MBL fold metallo-hydrolase [Kiloniellales bacterium]